MMLSETASLTHPSYGRHRNDDHRKRGYDAHLGVAAKGKYILL